MSKLRMVALSACILIVLAVSLQRARARPGPPAFVVASVESNAGTELQLHSAETEFKELINQDRRLCALTLLRIKSGPLLMIDKKPVIYPVTAAKLPEREFFGANDFEHFDFEAKIEIVCAEAGICDERRRLVDHTDYKNDGPNNPITDPPH